MVEPKDKAQKVADFEKSDPNFVLYVRPLNDYARMFRDVYRRRNDLFALEAELKTQVDQIAAAAKLVQDDVKAATDEQAGLKKDLAKFKSEYDAVVAFNAAVAAKQTEVNAKCSELFRANLRLNGQLADVEQKIIDAASRQPPAEASALRLGAGLLCAEDPRDGADQRRAAPAEATAATSVLQTQLGNCDFDRGSDSDGNRSNPAQDRADAEQRISSRADAA